jgi:hypothetical protein
MILEVEIGITNPNTGLLEPQGVRKNKDWNLS